MKDGLPGDTIVDRKRPEGEPPEEKPPSESKPEAIAPPPRTFKQKALRLSLIVFGSLLLAFLLYRWAGTSVLLGHVQRVYEKGNGYKIEFVEKSGEVSVLENTPIRFPHFKLETADLQAQLHHFSETGDIIELKVWGLRLSWLEYYPNAIEAEFVSSNEDRRKAQVQAISYGVMNELIDQGVVTRGPESEKVRPGLEAAISRGLKEPSSSNSPPSSPSPDGDEKSAPAE